MHEGKKRAFTTHAPHYPHLQSLNLAVPRQSAASRVWVPASPNILIPQPYCRFNARVLHRIGLFRWGLHFLLEASEPLPAPVTVVSADTSAECSPSATTSSSTSAPDATTAAFSGPSLSERGAAGGADGAAGKPQVRVAIAGFGGVKRPTAAVAAAGLDTRDGFMVSCTLLLQRVLATCTIQRDFDRVIGATLSTLADGGATGAREVRAAGTEPAFAAAETVLEAAKLLGDKGSAGNKVLSGQAMVRLYLLRMLLEIVALPTAAASKGELLAAEGMYVGGVGSPCAREAQAAVEHMSLGSGCAAGDGGAAAWGSRLERWVDGAPPVVDVAADGVGLLSPLYVGRWRLFKTVCNRALRPDWFISLLETCREEVRRKNAADQCLVAVVFFKAVLHAFFSSRIVAVVGIPFLARMKFAALVYRMWCRICTAVFPWQSPSA